jgi:hypothetical protein
MLEQCVQRVRQGETRQAHRHEILVSLRRADIDARLVANFRENGGQRHVVGVYTEQAGLVANDGSAATWQREQRERRQREPDSGLDPSPRTIRTRRPVHLGGARCAGPAHAQPTPRLHDASPDTVRSARCDYLQQRNGRLSDRTINAPAQAEPRSVGLAPTGVNAPAKTGQSPPQVKQRLQATAVWLFTACAVTVVGLLLPVLFTACVVVCAVVCACAPKANESAIAIAEQTNSLCFIMCSLACVVANADKRAASAGMRRHCCNRAVARGGFRAG